MIDELVEELWRLVKTDGTAPRERTRNVLKALDEEGLLVRPVKYYLGTPVELIEEYTPPENRPTARLGDEGWVWCRHPASEGKERMWKHWRDQLTERPFGQAESSR